MTSAIPAAADKPAVNEKRGGIPRAGSKPEEFGGLVKINMATGEIQHIYKGRAPGNGAVLTTAGDLVFWGDLDRKFRAFDAASGKMLWEPTLGGSIQNSTITYAVNGKQYIAVMSGEGLLTGGIITQAGIRRHGGTMRSMFLRCRDQTVALAVSPRPATLLASWPCRDAARFTRSSPSRSL